MYDPQRKGEAFRSLHAGEPFVIPNPWDAGSARVLEALGFKAVASTSSGFAFRRPRVKANPELVLATALNPSASRTRAEPASHGFGITNGSPAWSDRKASPFRCGSYMVDLDHDLPPFAGSHDSIEGRPRVLQREDRVDGRTEDPVGRQVAELDELFAIRLDHEVGRV